MILFIEKKYIREVDGEYCVYSEQTGKSFGCYKTKPEAEARLAQMRKFKGDTMEPYVKEVGKVFVREVKGGSGSGNFGHEGRPGERGGSGAGGGGTEKVDPIRQLSDFNRTKPWEKLQGYVFDKKENFETHAKELAKTHTESKLRQYQSISSQQYDSTMKDFVQGKLNVETAHRSLFNSRFKEALYKSAIDKIAFPKEKGVDYYPYDIFK